MASSTVFANSTPEAIRFPSYGSYGSDESSVASMTSMTSLSYAHDMHEHTSRQMEAARRSANRLHGEGHGEQVISSLNTEGSASSMSSIDNQTS